MYTLSGGGRSAWSGSQKRRGRNFEISSHALDTFAFPFLYLPRSLGCNRYQSTEDAQGVKVASLIFLSFHF